MPDRSIVVARARLEAPARPEPRVDWATTIIAATSFLFHFGALASLWSDWTDPVVDDGLVIAGLIEAARELPRMPSVEDADDPAIAGPEPTERARETKAREPHRSTEPRTGARPSRDDARAAAMARDLAALDAQMLGALGGHGPTTDRVLGPGSLPSLALDEASATERKSFVLGSGGAVPRPGERTATLAELGDRSAGPAGDGPGRAREVKVPRGAMCRPPMACDPAVPTSEIPDAAAVIAGLKGAFRRCYQRGLDQEDPTMHGAVRVVAKIAPNGDVVSATPSVTGNVTASVAGCIASKIAGAQFSPPKNGVGAVLVVPVAVKAQ